MDGRGARPRERRALAATRAPARTRRLAPALVALAALAAACTTATGATTPPASPRKLAAAAPASTTTSTSTTTTLAPTTTTSTLPPIAIPAVPFRVGSQTYDWTDWTRPTPANNDYRAKTHRELVTTIWYPAIGTPSTYVQSDATPDHAAGPFPLVLFAHGHGGEPADYLSEIVAWASRGYVVVAPEFPLSNRRAYGGPSYTDLTEQPGDLSFVLTQALELNAQAGSWMYGLVDARRIGAIGHSEGAWTVLALAANPCCRDRRVTAAVVLAGQMSGVFTQPFYSTGAPPLLFVHARDDKVVQYARARAAYFHAPAPKFFLTLPTGGHVAPYEAAGSRTDDAVLTVTNSFLDRYLKSLAAVKIASPDPAIATLVERITTS